MRFVVEPPQLLEERRQVPRAGGMGQSPIVERLALGDEGRASFRLTPRAYHYHRARRACRMGARMKPLSRRNLRLRAMCTSFKRKLALSGFYTRRAPAPG